MKGIYCIFTLFAFINTWDFKVHLRNLKEQYISGFFPTSSIDLEITNFNRYDKSLFHCNCVFIISTFIHWIRVLLYWMKWVCIHYTVNVFNFIGKKLWCFCREHDFVWINFRCPWSLKYYTLCIQGINNITVTYL